MNQAATDGILFETVHRRGDGTTFPVEVSSRATTLGEEVVLLSIVRDITARKQAEQALATRMRHLEALRAVSEEITRELDLTRLLHLLIVRAAELVGAAAATLYLWEPEQARVVPTTWHGLGEWQGALYLRLGEGIAGTVAQTRRGLCVNDYRSSPYAHPVTLQHTHLTASLGAPLCYREELVGAITLSHEGGRRFAPPTRNSCSSSPRTRPPPSRTPDYTTSPSGRSGSARRPRPSSGGSSAPWSSPPASS
jgi:PAS domain-containing protein